MTSREILIYLAVKHKGDWESIHDDFQTSVSEDGTQKYKYEEDFDENKAKKLISNIKSSAVTILDEEYPEDLKNITRPPYVLFYHGDISLLKRPNKLAVVGSRHCSDYGLEETNRFVKELCKDFVIVSGNALGVDVCAHRACLESGGKTIAVLGSGINVCYLKDNLDVYEACKKNNLVISEYPNNVEPQPKNFPTRNRIIVGISDALLVTEGKSVSGTKITALLMADKNGNVCCIPTRLHEDSICNALIKGGAFLVEEPEDVYDVANVRPTRPVFEK